MASRTAWAVASCGSTAVPSKMARWSRAAVSSGSATATRTAPSAPGPSVSTRATLAKLIGTRLASSAEASSASTRARNGSSSWAASPRSTSSSARAFMRTRISPSRAPACSPRCAARASSSLAGARPAVWTRISPSSRPASVSGRAARARAGWRGCRVGSVMGTKENTRPAPLLSRRLGRRQVEARAAAGRPGGRHRGRGDGRSDWRRSGRGLAPRGGRWHGAPAVAWRAASSAGRGRAFARSARAAVLELERLALHVLAQLRVGAGLPLVLDERLVARGRPVEGLQELLLLATLPLVDALVVGLVADDVGGEEEEQVRLRLGRDVVAEEPAQHRDVAQDGRLVHRLDGALLDEPADDDGALVLHRDVGLHRALGGGRAERRVLARDLLRLLVDLQPDVVALRDLRLDAQPQLHVLALDGGDAREAAQEAGRGRGGGGGAGGPGEAGQVRQAGAEPGLERHVLPDRDLGVLVVGGEDVRGRDDVHVRAGLERLDQHRDARDARQHRAELGRGGPDEAGQEAAQLHQAARVEGADAARLRADGDVPRAIGRLVRDGGVGRHAELLLVLEVDLQDDGLDEHLPARAVELVHQPLDGGEVGAAGEHDERVRHLVGGDLHLAGEQGGGGDARRTPRARRRLHGLELWGRGAPRGGAAARAPRRRLALRQRGQRLGEVLGG